MSARLGGAAVALLGSILLACVDTDAEHACAREEYAPLCNIAVTGISPAIGLEGGGTTVTIYFKTAAGRFGVDMSRTDKDADWRVHRIVFPGQDSVFE